MSQQNKISRLKKIAAAVATAISLASGAPLSAQTSNPASRATVGELKILVTAVQGGSQYRIAAGEKWQTITKDMTLPEGVELRTGPRGAIQFTIGTDQVYRVDRLTVVRVLRASLLADGSIKTDVGLQYGRVSKDTDAPERPHDDTIVSPSSTLAVRGTRVSLYDQPPYEPEAVSLTGRAVFDTIGRERVAFGAKGEGTAVVNATNTDPAGNALTASIVDPSIANARTPAEQRLLADLITNGAVVSFNNALMLPVVRGGPVPTDPQLPTLIPGDLIFIIRWDTNTNVDLQLVSATNGGGETIVPVFGLNSSPSGGHILFDHQGGPNGGFEIITYPNTNFPIGAYSIFAANRGPLPTNVTFNGFVNDGTSGQMPQMFNSPSNPFVGVAQPTQTAAVGFSAAQIAQVSKDPPNVIYSFGSGGFTDFSKRGPLAAAPQGPMPAPPAPAINKVQPTVSIPSAPHYRYPLPPTKR